MSFAYGQIIAPGNLPLKAYHRKSAIKMVFLDDLPNRLDLDDPEERRIITGVSWEKYEALLADLGDNSAYRVAYLD
ncbi:hypothetical protein K9N68_23145 [Kovacikia minuta CCNUW1]|uniref:hypothetical protein n=1 Tax=Kovacikia minuta TaxID=2931930 RepID=UPI001CCBDB61|nr:hypothetical protein [Kovacikia minuta]UBF24565.1 hypothetical protein K9N68_23145 [Kovacikia minuta CCNUW1]